MTTRSTMGGGIYQLYATLALCALPACDHADFESLGGLMPPPQVEPRDAGAPIVPTPPVDSGAFYAPDAAALSLPAGGAESLAAGSGGRAGGAAAGMGGSGGGGGRASPAPLTGTLNGTPFGPVKVGFVIGVSDELGATTLYLLDSAVTCSQISSLAWLTQLPSSQRVIEIMLPTNAATGTIVSTSVISYAAGGTFSFTKTQATTRTLILTQYKSQGVVEGTLTATFPSGSIMGAFHADFCATGMSF